MNVENERLTVVRSRCRYGNFTLSFDSLRQQIDHFTVSCLVAWPLNESEAGGDLVLIETSLLFSC